MAPMPEARSAAGSAPSAVTVDGLWSFPLREDAVTTRAAIVAGGVALSLVLLGVLVVQSVICIVAEPGSVVPWTPVPLLVLAGCMVVASRSEPLTLARYGALAASALAAFAALTVAMADSPAQAQAGTAGFVLSITTSGAVVAGTIFDHWTGGIAGAVLGLVAVEGAIALTAAFVGLPYRLDLPPIMFTLGLLASYALFPLARARARGGIDTLVAADRRMRARRMRELEGRASIAHLHDTLLGTLAALAARQAGELTEQERAEIERALESTALLPVLRGAPGGAREPAGDWIRAVGEARGVRVALEGDAAALDTLPHPTADALRGALEQCLVNIGRHAGVTEAWVSITASDEQLSVTVVDEGAGFDPEAVPDDRLGLSESVRGRVERLGGEVRVWSSPGAGTSVYLVVPRGG